VGNKNSISDPKFVACSMIKRKKMNRKLIFQAIKKEIQY
jgi:hypothetical protein